MDGVYGDYAMLGFGMTMGPVMISGNRVRRDIFDFTLVVYVCCLLFNRKDTFLL